MKLSISITTKAGQKPNLITFEPRNLVLGLTNQFCCREPKFVKHRLNKQSCNVKSFLCLIFLPLWMKQPKVRFTFRNSKRRIFYVRLKVKVLPVRGNEYPIRFLRFLFFIFKVHLYIFVFLHVWNRKTLPREPKFHRPTWDPPNRILWPSAKHTLWLKVGWFYLTALKGLRDVTQWFRNEIFIEERKGFFISIPHVNDYHTGKRIHLVPIENSIFFTQKSYIQTVFPSTLLKKESEILDI